MVPVPASDVSLMSTPPGSGLPSSGDSVTVKVSSPSTRSSSTVAKLTVFEAVSLAANSTVPVTA